MPAIIMPLVSCTLLSWALCCKMLHAQCPPAHEVLARLTSIQGNTAINIDSKINELQRLRHSFLSCHKIKDSTYARIAHRLADVYGKAKDFEKAISFSNEAIRINARNDRYAEKPYLAHTYLNMGLFHKWAYLPQKSLLYFDSCISISRQFPDKYFILFMAFEEKAYGLFEAGDYQRCIECADEGIFFARRVKDSLQEVNLLSRKAQAELALGYLQQAEPNIKKAISFYKKNTVDSNQLAINYSIYANLLDAKGDIKSAIQFHQKSFDLNWATGHWVECSRNMLNLGHLYDRHLKHYEKAYACYKQGIEVLKNTYDPYQLAGLYINTGVLYWHQKKYTKALQFYQKALNALPIRFADTSIKSNPGPDLLRLVANDYFVTTLLSNKGESLLAQYDTEVSLKLVS